MGCYGWDREGLRHNVTVVLLSEQLLYDIENYCHIEGHLVEMDELSHLIQDVLDAGNEDRIWRVLDICHSRLNEALYPFTKEPVWMEYGDNRLHEREQYVFELTLPDSFSQTTLCLIKRLMHEYMACRGVYEWLSITARESATAWQEKSDAAMSEIRGLLTQRRGRTRRSLHPF